MGIFHHEEVEPQHLRGYSKNSSSSKATASFTRGAYVLYVSTAQWRLACAKADPVAKVGNVTNGLFLHFLQLSFIHKTSMLILMLVHTFDCHCT